MTKSIIQKLFIVFTFLISLQLSADGGFFWNKGADLEQPSQNAAIYFNDELETLILQVKYEGNAKDFAWIIPLPSKPEVKVLKKDDSSFQELFHYIHERDPEISGCELACIKGRAVEHKTVGVYDLTVLNSSSYDLLTSWLKKNGYSVPNEAIPVLKHYVKKKWHYVAMRINSKDLTDDTEAKLKKGMLNPIKFTFKTKEAVYPLKISSINKGKTLLRLYVLAEKPLRTVDTLGKNDMSIEKNIPLFFDHKIKEKDAFQDLDYGTYKKCNVQELPRTWSAFGIDKKRELYLCKYLGWFGSEEMKKDLSFAPFVPVKYFEAKLDNTESLGLRWRLVSFLIHKNRKKYSNLQIELLKAMSKSEDRYLCQAAARNELTPKDCFRNCLSKHQLIDYALADNPKVPSGVLFELVTRSKYSYARDRALEHKNISLEHLKKLGDSESRYISEKAKKILKGRQKK